LAALAGYFAGPDEPWWLVPVLLFVLDVFMAERATEPSQRRVASDVEDEVAALYNAAHSYPLPAVLGVLASVAEQPLWQRVALVWIAHIGMGLR
jgi:Domain of unknown function (DUF4260)